ncbi:MAG: hypothetical protein A2Z59_12930 [Nitrospinae bacterium RIFCSPLOWO2_02_39_17]|nr:MAG: hypothetical protein A2W53_08285 [Nitrospinae bacterium RIFCSPHIGHO2_02_39_11]OGV98569.1 MAG: hypothetical protein A3D97_06590 [Nitrospinae bacterium RIFCSPHIGHO2_12_FULL_39_42]OGW01301.1 MAG: hypothetical protein A2Z59_12930 [Nitrospinae bacterium RIFCSPLOWO2_02_39_17]OGW11192.1 MAG: hypothetical protein A2W75_09760 [Nitrospinae bacterium RIFCSPLOWO2_12_39_15]
MRKEDIQTKIDAIFDNHEKLKFFSSKTYEEFTADFRNIDSALHRLQTSIQALLDIGSYIIASLGLRTPNTNAEIIDILNEAGYIPKDQVEKYKKMSQFRNRIVHLYNHIDTEMLYDILMNELDDIKEFYASLLNIIKQHE